MKLGNPNVTLGEKEIERVVKHFLSVKVHLNKTRQSSWPSACWQSRDERAECFSRSRRYQDSYDLVCDVVVDPHPEFVERDASKVLLNLLQ